MTAFAQLAQRVFNRPALIHPPKAELIMAALADRLGIAHLHRPDGSQVVLAQGGAQAFIDSASPARGRDTGYDVVAGVAVVPVCGTLVQKLGSLRPFSGMTGYDGIRLAFLTALEDPEVKAILLDIDSPGGEVAGCFDLVDMMYAARGQKPIWASCNEFAFSAAYAIASAADRITVPRTGGTGSVGVVCMHVDLSRALDTAGITVTLIQSGARKTDGADSKPLSDPARERLQAEIDRLGQLFADTVARNRGLASTAVQALEAGCFFGQDGIAAGLADAVLAPDAAFAALLNSL